jgi:hypothetical protein
MSGLDGTSRFIADRESAETEDPTRHHSIERHRNVQRKKTRDESARSRTEYQESNQDGQKTQQSRKVLIVYLKAFSTGAPAFSAELGEAHRPCLALDTGKTWFWNGNAPSDRRATDFLITPSTSLFDEVSVTSGLGSQLSTLLHASCLDLIAFTRRSITSHPHCPLSPLSV